MFLILRRLLVMVAVAVPLGALWLAFWLSHAPTGDAAPDGRLTGIRETISSAARTILEVLALAGRSAVIAAAVVIAGHLLGRYLRRTGPSILPGALGTLVDAQRARRAPVCREIVLGRDDRATPYEVAKLLDGLHGALRVRWYERVLLGADTLCLGIVNHPASSTVRFTVSVRADTVDAIHARLRATYPDIRLAAIDLWPHGTPGGPLARLTGRAAGRCALEVVRLKKTRRWLWSLQTTRDYTHSPVEALVATLAGSQVAAITQLALTPAPRALERLADRAIRNAEQRLNTQVALSPTAPGVQSAVAQKHLQGAVEAVGRGLFFIDYRLCVPRGRLDVARHLAGVASEARAENSLARRVMRARRRLYAERVARGIPPLLPGLWRGVCSTAELATLWHLPTLRVKGIGLQRSGSRQIAAAAAISRDPRDMLMLDEHGPVGIRPADRRYGIAVIGAAGGGKTALTARHVGNVARDPSRALIVIDPKEDLARDSLAAIPTSRTVHYLDLAHPHVGLNPLTALRARGIRPEVTSDVMVCAIRESSPDGAVGPRSDQFLRAGISAVCIAEHIPTLHHVYRMLDPDDPGYRDWVLRELALHPETEYLRDFWGRRFQARAKTNPRFLAEIMEAPLNKLARFLAVPSLAYLTSHPVTLDLPALIDRREILVVRGSKGAVGEDNAVLFMQTLVLLVQKLLHQQQRLERHDRAQVAIVIDEAHNLFTPSFATMLSEGRSGGLEVLAAFQYTQQIQDDRVRAGIKSLLQNICIFRLREFEDARAAAALAMEVYADNIRGDDDDAQRLRIDPVDVINLPNYRSINLWLADGVPQHASTATTIPTEHIHQLPGARACARTHLERQAQRGHHPHDHGQAIRPPAVWSATQPALAHGREVLVDLTDWPQRPDSPHELRIELAPIRGGGALAYPARAGDQSARRIAVTIPADPADAGYLPPGDYTVRVHAAHATWTPIAGADDAQQPATITLACDATLRTDVA